MNCMLITERAVFFQFDTFRIILLILYRIVISLLAFCACHDNLYSHVHTSL